MQNINSLYLMSFTVYKTCITARKNPTLKMCPSLQLYSLKAIDNLVIRAVP